MGKEYNSKSVPMPNFNSEVLHTISLLTLNFGLLENVKWRASNENIMFNCTLLSIEQYIVT